MGWNGEHGIPKDWRVGSTAWGKYQANGINIICTTTLFLSLPIHPRITFSALSLPLHKHPIFPLCNMLCHNPLTKQIMFSYLLPECCTCGYSHPVIGSTDKSYWLPNWYHILVQRYDNKRCFCPALLSQRHYSADQPCLKGCPVNTTPYDPNNVPVISLPGELTPPSSNVF